MIDLVPAVTATAAAVLDMVCRASSDPAICSATYLPAGMTTEDAQRWLRTREQWCWVIRVDGVPAGMLSLQEPDRCVRDLVPVGTMEREVWLLPQWRGRRIVAGAMDMVRDGLCAAGIGHVVGIAWETNSAAIAGMRNAGFSRLGRVWWSGTGEAGGWCEAWIADVCTQDAGSSGPAC